MGLEMHSTLQRTRDCGPIIGDPPVDRELFSQVGIQEVLSVTLGAILPSLNHVNWSAATVLRIRATSFLDCPVNVEMLPLGTSFLRQIARAQLAAHFRLPDSMRKRIDCVGQIDSILVPSVSGI